MLDDGQMTKAFFVHYQQCASKELFGVNSVRSASHNVGKPCCSRVKVSRNHAKNHVVSSKYSNKSTVFNDHDYAVFFGCH